MVVSLTKTQMKRMIKPREKNAHKGDFGRILVYAGSMGMVGAAILCGKAAFRSGAGLVQFYLPEELIPIVQGALPEATCLKRGTLNEYHQYQALVIGPGLGKNKQDYKELETIFQTYQGTVVLDADGLNALADARLRQWVKSSKAHLIMTPHPGEAKRLLNSISPDLLPCEEREVMAKTISDYYHSITLVKGADTIIACRDHHLYRNPTGNPGMATAGSGDVLSGIIAGLAGQGYLPTQAALLGTYLHGLSGDLAKEDFSEESIMAGDLVENIPSAWKLLKGVEENHE